MPNEIVVVNKHHGHTVDDRTIYIGRPSLLGNPFTIEGKQTRTAVLKNYTRWLEWKIEMGNAEVVAELDRIASLVLDDSGLPVKLLCFCAPQACHGDVLKRVIEQAIKEQA